MSEIAMKTIYFAGPCHSVADRAFINMVAKELRDRCEVYVPHESGISSGDHLSDKKLFEKDIKQLFLADIVVAWLDGVEVDAGTAAEVGFAFAEKKNIIGLHTQQGSINLMLVNMCGVIVDDIVRLLIEVDLVVK